MEPPVNHQHKEHIEIIILTSLSNLT
jgi:hypothetical protein